MISKTSLKLTMPQHYLPNLNECSFSSANDSIYGLIIQAGINLLTNTNDINGAIEFGEEALKKISGLNRKGNANEYIIATSLATLYAGNILIPQPYEVRKRVSAISKSIRHRFRELWGILCGNSDDLFKTRKLLYENGRRA